MPPRRAEALPSGVFMVFALPVLRKFRIAGLRMPHAAEMPPYYFPAFLLQYTGKYAIIKMNEKQKKRKEDFA
jgi:hypothetical protein